MRVTKEFVFDAAHHLPDYEGKCRRIHGHRWTLRVSVDRHARSVMESPGGMVIDFSILKDLVEKAVIDRWDHQDLNLDVSNPTCENLLLIIGLILEPVLDWDTLELEESPGSCAQITRKEYELVKKDIVPF